MELYCNYGILACQFVSIRAHHPYRHHDPPCSSTLSSSTTLIYPVYNQPTVVAIFSRSFYINFVGLIALWQPLLSFCAYASFVPHLTFRLTLLMHYCSPAQQIESFSYTLNFYTCMYRKLLCTLVRLLPGLNSPTDQYVQLEAVETNLGCLVVQNICV